MNEQFRSRGTHQRLPQSLLKENFMSSLRQHPESRSREFNFNTHLSFELEKFFLHLNRLSEHREGFLLSAQGKKRLLKVLHHSCSINSRPAQLLIEAYQSVRLITLSTHRQTYQSSCECR